MPVNYGFRQYDGTVSRPQAASLTPVEYAFTALSGGVGMPVLDEVTIDEFTRRAELYQKYVGPVWRNGDGTPRIFTRIDFESLLPGAWTNWTKVSKRDFDAAMKKEKAAYEAHQARLEATR